MHTRSVYYYLYVTESQQHYIVAVPKRGKLYSNAGVCMLAGCAPVTWWNEVRHTPQIWCICFLYNTTLRFCVRRPCYRSACVHIRQINETTQKRRNDTTNIPQSFPFVQSFAQCLGICLFYSYIQLRCHFRELVVNKPKNI